MAEVSSAESSGTSERTPLGANYFKLFWAGTISNLGDGIAVIAYPWLASAITRNPVLVALVAVVQRLPWLLFSLPAGVVTDRVDRRTIIVRANVVRAIITTVVAVVVLARSDQLPGPDQLSDGAAVVGTDGALYAVLLLATLLLGIGEVFADNAAQTFMPSLVPASQLEKANGRMWSTEQVANTFAGPPIAAGLVVVAFSLPFFVDAVTFAVAAVLVALIPAHVRRTDVTQREHASWKADLGEGFRWLWDHQLLRHLAITLGGLNALFMMTTSILVLYSQEVLGTSATEFALLSTGGAVGGVIGGWTASAISRRIGTGPSLWLTLLGGGSTLAVTGMVSQWPWAWLMLGIAMLLGVLWNVITVSLRQTIIPDHLLGRVNSVYRFFGWGMMPVGALLGGLVVAVTDQLGSREMALRMPWLIAGALHLLLFAYAGPRLTTAKIEAARQGSLSSRVGDDG